MIPLVRPLIGEEEAGEMVRVLRSGRLAGGEEVAGFEAEFAAFAGVRAGVATSNGTTALWLGLWGAGIGPGDEVVVPSFTFAATAEAVLLCGARPVYADIDLESYCITADTVRPVLGPRTAAVIAVHLYGHPAPMAELSELCNRHGLLLAEDAAQAHGALLGGRSAGSLGDFGVFSFYATKNMTTGEGGMLTTDDGELAVRVESLRNHGQRRRYEHLRLGTNARMTDLAAALGRVQLRHLPERNERRAANAAWLNGRLGDVVATPQVRPGVVHVYHQYTVRHPDRRRLADALDAAGIGYGIYYPVGCHRQPALADPEVDLPETERACDEVISLPVRPDLTASELEAVASAVVAGAS